MLKYFTAVLIQIHQSTRGNSMWDPYAEFEKTVLPNGLAVYASQWSGRPWQYFSFIIHAGSKEDAAGLEGTLHFVEHLVSANAPRSFEEMELFFNDLGGQVNFGRTSFKATRYDFSIPAQVPVLAGALELFGSMLLTGSLTNEIESQRQVILGEFRRLRPHSYVYELDLRCQRALYPKSSWLAIFDYPLGAPPSIEAICAGDLQNSYDKYYVPANMSVVSVGGMPHEEVLQTLSGSPFGMEKKGERVAIAKPGNAVWLPAENRYDFKFSDIFESKTKLDVGRYKSAAVLPGAFSEKAVELLSEMLDVLLTEEVRKKRSWCYHIDSSFANFLNCYQFGINCNGVALEALDSIERVVDVCIATLEDRADLFERIKRQKLAQRAMKDYTGKAVCDGAVHDVINFDRVVSSSEEDDLVRAITFDHVLRILPYLASHNRWTMLMRP